MKLIVILLIFILCITVVSISNALAQSSHSLIDPLDFHKKGLLSPLKQLESGILPKDIQCKQGFVLLVKVSNNSPACVKPTTAQKLVEHRWGIMINLLQNKIYSNYTNQVSSVNNTIASISSPCESHFSMQNWIPLEWNIVSNQKTPGPKFGKYKCENVVPSERNAILKVTDNGHNAGEIYSTKDFKYGTYEINMTIDKTTGLTHAFFLYDYKTQNEIDIMEMIVKRCDISNSNNVCITPTSTIHFNSSKELDTFAGKTRLVPFNEDSSSYNDPEFNMYQFKLIWSPDDIEVLIDGELFHKFSVSDAKTVQNFANMSIHVNSWPSDSKFRPPTDSKLIVDTVKYLPQYN
jgi:hypothetical protein